MRPLGRLLLGAGVTYSQFDEIAKRAFVEEALGHPDSKGRTTNISRVAVRTGLSRKEVARVKQLIESKARPAESEQSVRPARVLQLWHSEPAFLDGGNIPLDLTFDEDRPSFSDLVKRVGGDVPAGAVRAELIAAGAIVELPNGRLRALKRFFVPATLDEDLVIGFAFVVAPVLETLSHNISNPSSALIQRTAYSDHLSEEALSNFRRISHEQAEGLITAIDKWLSLNESAEVNAEDSSKRAGVGVFYFESRPNAAP
jgi:hypothetical protein